MKKKLIIFVIGIIILIISAIAVVLLTKSNDNITITATKTVLQEDGKSTVTKYTINIKNYVATIQKVIKFPTKEEAKASYKRHELINEAEAKNYILKLKGKKLIVTIPEESFKADIEYDMQKDVTIIMKDGEHKEVINQSAVIEALQNQGYEVK